MDFIASSPTSEKRLAIVHIHGGAWVAGSKGKFYSKPLTEKYRFETKLFNVTNIGSVNMSDVAGFLVK